MNSFAITGIVFRWIAGGLLLLWAVIGSPAMAEAEPNPAELAKAVVAIENLDAMRTSLAAYRLASSDADSLYLSKI